MAGAVTTEGATCSSTTSVMFNARLPATLAAFASRESSSGSSDSGSGVLNTKRSGIDCWIQMDSRPVSLAQLSVNASPRRSLVAMTTLTWASRRSGISIGDELLP